MLAVKDIPPNNNNNNNDDDDEKQQIKPFLKLRFELLGIPVSSGYCICKTQQQKRKDLMNGVELSN